MKRKEEARSGLELTPERRSKVDQLSEADIGAIDRNLLENASPEWSKVSRVVLTTMIERDEGVSGLPESFYCGRIGALVKEGVLESQGDLSDMKSSEVRLPAKK